MILLLRFAILLVLYLFLWQLISVIWKDLRRPSPGEAKALPEVGRLVVVDGGSSSYEPGHRFPLFGTTTVGRGPDNDLVLSDGFVSSNHAILSLRDGSWWLSDLGSRNGSWVNGEKIAGEVQLHPGDVVAIGQVKLKLAR